MEQEEIKVGMLCHLMAMGNRVFVITDIRDDLFPIGVAIKGQTKAEMYVRPMAIKPINSSTDSSH